LALKVFRAFKVMLEVREITDPEEIKATLVQKVILDILEKETQDPLDAPEPLEILDIPDPPEKVILEIRAQQEQPVILDIRAQQDIV
jgi:hypothetical protein